MRPARYVSTALAVLLVCCSLPCMFPSHAGAVIAGFRAAGDASSGVAADRWEFRRMAAPLRSGSPEALLTIDSGQMKPLSLAAGDFNGDGMPDAVIGYGDDTGNHAAEVRWGNPDSLFPNSAEALGHKTEGSFSSEPYAADSLLVTLPARPGFLVAGDFNADGTQDLALGSAGDAFFFVLPGDGRGGFEAPVRIDLAGTLTWLYACDVNRRDGFPEIIAGVNGGNGPVLLVYEGTSGALGADPESIDLPSEAVDGAFGNFDDFYPRDMAILLASGEVVVVYGRDRELSFDEERRAAVPEPVTSTLPLTNAVALASGDFFGTGRDTLAVLGADGSITVTDPGGNTAFKQVARVAAASTNGASASKLKLVAIPAGGGDRIVLYGAGRTAISLAGSATLGAGAGDSTVQDAPAVAVLPARIDADAFTDLLVLGTDASAPLGTFSATNERIFVVTSDGCPGDANVGDGICANVDGECTLNAAMLEVGGVSGTGTGTIRFNLPGDGVPDLCAVTATPPSALYDGTTQAAGFVRIGGIGGNLRFGDNTVLRGIVTRDNTWVGDDSTVEGCKPETELHVASNCTVGGTIEAARNIFQQYGGVAGLLIEGNNNVVQGNWFGYNPGAAGPNRPESIRIDTPTGETTGPSNNLIGGTVEGARNVIVGNGTSKAVKIDPWTSGNRFQGNYLGTDATGMTAAGSSESLSGIILGGIGNTVGGTAAAARNLIVGAGNGQYGYGISVVGVPGATQGLVIQGNWFGLDKTGTGRIGTWQRGVHIGYETESITLGGAVSGAGNVIAGASFCGVILQGKDEDTDTQGNGGSHVVQGNFIGTDATGTVAIPNRYGMLITYSPGNLVGGAGVAARNVISGNSSDGIHIVGETATRNAIRGNYIGVDATGGKALAQPGWGVYVESSPSNTIGGCSRAARNVISCNGQGNVRIQNVESTGNKVQGNALGTTANGTGDPGAAGYWGVLIAGGASNNFIGGRQDGAGNTIAFSTESGVAIITDTSVGNSILANSIHSIGKMGIDLGYDGVTPNDYLDADTGPNNLQNAPEITSIDTATRCVVHGKLHSEASTKYRLEFFSSCTLNAEGMTAGKDFLGARYVTTSSLGDALFSYPFPIPPCPLITATATDPAGNTSEYSLWVAQTSPIFKDPFTDSEQWKEVTGSWSLESGTFVAGTQAKNVAIVKAFDPVTSPVGATRIQSTVKLAPDESAPNAALLFGYKKPNQTRWLQVQKGKVSLGQTGTINGTSPGTLDSARVSLTPGKAYVVKLDIFNDGRVDVTIGNKMVLSATFENGTAAGGIGIQSNQSRATFDNFSVWAPSVLPEE